MDVVTYVVHYTSLKQTAGEASEQNVNKKDNILQHASLYQLPSSKRLKNSWGIRYKSEGDTRGRTYVNKYKAEIRLLYKRGSNDTSIKK